MELQPPGTPVADPFFAAVRRRHPDVDIVLLPAGPDSTSTDPVDDASVTETLERVSVAAARLWSVSAPELTDAPEARVGFGPGPGSVVATARAGTRTPEGSQVLARIHSALERDGWDVARPPGPVERLFGRLDDLQVRASYAEESGTLLVELGSGAMQVGTDRARELVRR